MAKRPLKKVAGTPGLLSEKKEEKVYAELSLHTKFGYSEME